MSVSSKITPEQTMLTYRLGHQHRQHIAERLNTTTTTTNNNTDLYTELLRSTVSRTEKNHIKSNAANGTNGTVDDGLGRFPAKQITSASSVLLFNSSENPYKNYDSVNNLESVADYRDAIKKLHNDNSNKELAAAPVTISEGIDLPSFTNLQFDYRPELGLVPTFNVPEQLALKNVAHISFQNESVNSGNNNTNNAQNTSI